jgi:hypothetical protein
MIIHQQSIIDFNISSIEGNENLFIEYFNITKGLFLYVKDLMKIDLKIKNRFLVEGLITLTN